MKQTQISPLRLIVDSIVIFKKVFIPIFAFSVAGLFPTLMFSKILNKSLLALYYYDLPGKYLIDAALPFVLGVISFFILTFAICINTFIVGGLKRDVPTGVLQAVISAKRKYFLYILVKVRCIVQVLVGIIFFVVPGIFWGAVYSFSGIVVLLEDKKIDESFLYSRKVVGEQWISYLDYLLLLVFFFMICGGALSGLDFAYEHALLTNRILTSKMIDLFSTAVMIIFVNVAYIYFIGVYQALRERTFDSNDKQTNTG